MVEYKCNRCSKVEHRSVAGWKIECHCGGVMATASASTSLMTSENIKAFRKSKRWSQKLTAEILGISREYYCQIELGTRSPALRTSLRIRQMLQA